MLFQSSDRDPPTRFRTPLRSSGSLATTVVAFLSPPGFFPVIASPRPRSHRCNSRRLRVRRPIPATPASVIAAPMTRSASTCCPPSRERQGCCRVGLVVLVVQGVDRRGHLPPWC